MTRGADRCAHVRERFFRLSKDSDILNKPGKVFRVDGKIVQPLRDAA